MEYGVALLCIQLGLLNVSLIHILRSCRDALIEEWDHWSDLGIGSDKILLKIVVFVPRLEISSEMSNASQVSDCRKGIVLEKDSELVLASNHEKILLVLLDVETGSAVVEVAADSEVPSAPPVGCEGCAAVAISAADVPPITASLGSFGSFGT
jgi:hypothetical protein